MRNALLLVAMLTVGCQQVSVVSRPPGAFVYVDSRLHGNTPAQIMLSTGSSHTVELALPGYRRHVVAIERVPREPVIDPRISNVSLAVSYLNMVANGHPAGLILGICGRVVMARFSADLVPRRIEAVLVPL